MSWLFLALFVLAGSYLVYVTLRSYSQLSIAGRYALLALRLLALGLILLALNGLTVTRTVNEKVCNIFVVDASRSISPASLAKAQDIVNKQIAAMGKDDASAVVVFGRDCSVVSSDGKPLKDLRLGRRSHRRPGHVHQPGYADGKRAVPPGLPQSPDAPERCAGERRQRSGALRDAGGADRHRSAGKPPGRRTDQPDDRQPLDPHRPALRNQGSARQQRSAGGQSHPRSRRQAHRHQAGRAAKG